MASGASRLYAGTYEGTGSALSITAPGFRPRFVILVNEDDPSFALHIDGMDDDSALTQDQGTTAFASSAAVTLTDSGFDLGTNATLNTAGETVRYICGD
jgi:hypothetical protein